jgi:uncharacterized protein (TIGR02569 family)
MHHHAGVIGTAPGDEVLADFGLAGARPVLLPGGEGRSWRAGDAVLKPAASPAADYYVAELFANLPESDAVRVPRPVRTVSDGWLSHGWAAWSWLAGESSTIRWRDIVAAGTALHTLLRGASRPAFLDDRDDVWSVGDRVAWQEQPFVIEHAELRASAKEFAAHLQPCDEAAQLVHGDLTGNVLIADGMPPAVIDMSCYWRPPSWALAVIAADALAWHNAGTGVIALLPEPHPVAMVARAALYRLVTSDRHASTLGSVRQSYLTRNATAYSRVIDALHELGHTRR